MNTSCPRVSMALPGWPMVIVSKSYMPSVAVSVLSAAICFPTPIKAPTMTDYFQDQPLRIAGHAFTSRLLVLEIVSHRWGLRSEEHTSELQSRPHLVCRLPVEEKGQVTV